MHLTVPGAPRKVATRPAAVGPGRLRKIGLIGGSPQTLGAAPWSDPSWEFWTHSSTVLLIPYLRCDRIFDLHPRHCFMEARKCGFTDYYAFLRSCPTPVYMQARVPDIPQSVRYPLELIRQQWPDVPFGSQAAYMIALALHEGVTHLGFFGINYAHDTEYQDQRANAEHWAGIARGLGVQLVIPEAADFCREPRELYGYESHSTPAKYDALKQKFAAAKAQAQAGARAARRVDLGQLVPADTVDAAAMAAKRATFDPAWASEVAKMGRDEQMSESFLRQLETQRAAAEQACAERARLIATEPAPVG